MKSAIVGLALAAGLGLMARSAEGTVLIFDNLKGPSGGPIAHYGPIDVGYGDRVTATSDSIGSYQMGNAFTPNVVVDYNTRQISGGAVVTHYLEFWSTNYGNLTNVAFPSSSAGNYSEIFLQPDAGYAVRLNSFDMGGYYESDHPGQIVRVRDGTSNTILFEESPTTIRGTGPSHSPYTPNVSSPNGLRIQVSFDDWNTAIDNINFDQIIAVDAVPEPGTMILLATGLIGIAAGWRCRKD